MNTYGKFNEQDQFEINRPDTPEPWLHYLIRPGQPGTETFCSGVSYAGGGFDVKGTHENTFVDTQLHLNDKDDMGRYVYVHDRDTDELWSSSWQPVRNPDQIMKTTLGFGSMVFDSSCAGIESLLTMIVPKDFDGWIQNIVIRNTTNRVRRLGLYPFVPVHMGDALARLLAGDNDGFFGGAAWDQDLQGIVFRRHHGAPLRDDPEKINGMLGNVALFYSTLNTAQTSYETSLEAFYGDRFHDQSNPASIQSGSLSKTDTPYLRRTCGVFQHEIELQPGEELEFAVAFVAGSTQDYYLNGKSEMRRILDWVRDAGARKKMQQNVSQYWEEHLGLLEIRTPDVQINRGFKWLQYQCEIVYVLNRMKSRYHTGYEYGWGFRDILQDVLFYLAYDPGSVRAALLHISTQMFSSGICYHNFFIDQPGNKAVEACDDPIWFPNAIEKYCKETGDFSILDELTDYAEVHEGTAGVQGSILEHCCAALDRVEADCSERHLPFLKDCDWNDDLNIQRIQGQPNRSMESVMAALQYYRVLLDTAALFEAAGKLPEKSAEFRERADRLHAAIAAHALDVEGYYKRVLFLDPEQEDLGSSSNTYGRIFLEPQVFGILSGVADSDQATVCLQAVEKYLDTDYGAMLCWPVFTDLSEHDTLPQRSWNIEKEPPAMKENGGIFMHVNAWLIQAYCMTGQGKKACELYKRILPENLSSDQDRYKSEPYVYPEYVRGKGIDSFGRGGHTWLTGTAPTMHQSLIEHILGLQPDFDGLRVNPCIDPEWKEFSIVRRFRGADYSITVRNPDSCMQGVKSMCVDGQEIAGSLLPVFEDGKLHTVLVILGESA
ncbi:GH36-type glycosyl hydrolase domain-containing protein [Spirochaeta dissipatitropha]